MGHSGPSYGPGGHWHNSELDSCKKNSKLISIQVCFHTLHFQPHHRDSNFALVVLSSVSPGERSKGGLFGPINTKRKAQLARLPNPKFSCLAPSLRMVTHHLRERFVGSLYQMLHVWNIEYLPTFTIIFMSNIGKYSSPMEHLGSM